MHLEHYATVSVLCRHTKEQSNYSLGATKQMMMCPVLYAHMHVQVVGSLTVQAAPWLIRQGTYVYAMRHAERV